MEAEHSFHEKEVNNGMVSFIFFAPFKERNYGHYITYSSCMEMILQLLLKVTISHCIPVL